MQPSVSDREVEAIAGEDEALSMEKAPEINSLHPSIAPKNRKKFKVKVNFKK